MDPILIVIAVLVIVGVTIPLVIMLKHKGKIGSPAWQLDAWSKNVKLDDPPKAGSILSFTFPNKDGVHTVFKYQEKALTKVHAMSIEFEITGNSPKFVAAGLLPELRLHIGGARLYSLGPNNAVALRLGRHKLSVPLTPDSWKTVDGFPCNYDAGHVDQFKTAIQESNQVAFIFGDEHGNAHGANLDGENGGTAEFRLISFSP